MFNFCARGVGWIFLASLVGIVSGLTSGVFLLLLEQITHWREAHRWAVALLPLGGLAIGYLYYRWGESIVGGSHLLISTLRSSPMARLSHGRFANLIPFRMSPFVFVGTLITHLFGGSAGREGTALQMGTSLADQFNILFKLSSADRRFLLMTGLSSSFSSVFGTPWTGTLFAWELSGRGLNRFTALVPCFVAAWVGNKLTLALGVKHVAYSITEIPPPTFTRFLLTLLAGLVFGIIAWVFVKLTHKVSELFDRSISYPPFRPLVGGGILALLVATTGWDRYLGLGIPTVVQSFGEKLPSFDFAGKTAFTALTLGSGFKGGEVTPLFFVGATLGNTLSQFLPLPRSLLAGLGLTAVFAGAAKAPLTSAMLAIELFGNPIGIYAIVACFTSRWCSGRASIYKPNRV